MEVVATAQRLGFRAMTERSRRLLVGLFGVVLILVAFGPALIGGGSLVSHDLVASHAPFDAHVLPGFDPENGPGDPINIHAHWSLLRDRLVNGEFSWWNETLAGGQPFLKGGVPFVNVLYLLVPAWYAPGLVAAVRALIAFLLTVGLLRSWNRNRWGAVAAGSAYAFSGFMVGWLNWPHSTVAALAPGLLWAVELAIRDPRWRRSVPIAGVVALMIWSNFPQVTAYLVIGALMYVLVRLGSERHDWQFRTVPASDRVEPESKRSLFRLGGVGIAAGALGFGLAAPHLIGFGEYYSWADTSQRTWSPDSSAGPEYLLTAFGSGFWGSDGNAPAWFGAGNWSEFNIVTGAAALLLALLGMAAGWSSDDRRVRAAVRGVAAFLGFGLLVAYIGGPVGVALGSLLPGAAGLMTRSKVLISLAVALLAGFGVDQLTGQDRDTGDSLTRSGSLRRPVRVAATIAVVSVLALLPSLRHWYHEASARGLLAESGQALLVPAVAAGVVLAVVVARLRRWLSPMGAGLVLVSVIAAELLVLLMAVPTTVDPDERLRATPAHEVVVAELPDGLRLGGEGYVFFPNTTASFGIDDIRGQMLKSDGYQALLRQAGDYVLDPRGGGTPTYPAIPINTPAELPIWDAMGVGIWAQYPISTPPGERIDPGDPQLFVDAADPQQFTTVVPAGGVRAVLFDVDFRAPTAVLVEVRVDGETVTDKRTRTRLGPFEMPVAVMGEQWPVGSEVTVSVVAETPGAMLVARGADDSLNVGFVTGGDDLRLLRTGDVILTERTSATPVRVFTAATVEPDADQAAAWVMERTGPVAVTQTATDLPTQPVADAEFVVNASSFAGDQVSASVSSTVPALVVFSVVEYPGWQATVDGVPAEIVRSDAAFMGVEIPAGDHTVELTFHPRHLRTGLVLAGGSLLMMAFLWWGARFWATITRRWET